MLFIPESKETKTPNIRETDVLDEIDITLYGSTAKLNEDQKDTIRNMVAVMRMRQTPHLSE